MSSARSPQETAARIGELLEHSDPAGAAQLDEAVRLLVELYGDGLNRILELLAERPDGVEQIEQLAEDPLICSLLLIHDLHPVDVTARVAAALEKVRPYLGSHAGGVELLGIDDAGVVHLQLEGSCDGCPSSAVTAKVAIEGAILEAAPELTGVEVEGVLAENRRELLQIHPYGECPVPVS
ncbi:MAG TPA: NifU family protein [Mycobacteriales bacterium]|nr:NifU family protein [Mycobacteriales bacterium]